MTDDDDLGRNPAPRLVPFDVIHVERAFSAQPTLGNALGPVARVHELPLPEALAQSADPDLIWVSDATLDAVHLLHERFPGARLLATVPRGAGPTAVLGLLAGGADLVLRDEGILLAAAALTAMARRLPARTGPSREKPAEPAPSPSLLDNEREAPRTPGTQPSAGQPGPATLDHALTFSEV